MSSPLNPGTLIGDWARSGRRLNEETLSIGDDFENEKWRAHRYVGSLVVTDLTNAGKRGKKVTVLTLHGMDPRSPFTYDVTDAILPLLRGGASLANVRKAMEAFKGRNAGFEERESRGVDVMPGGFQVIRIDTPLVYFEASYDGFLIRDKSDQYNLPTCIPAMRGGKRAIPAFYRWLKDNEQKVQGMKFGDVLKALSAADIGYHYYCAMD